MLRSEANFCHKRNAQFCYHSQTNLTLDAGLSIHKTALERHKVRSNFIIDCFDSSLPHNICNHLAQRVLYP